MPDAHIKDQSQITKEIENFWMGQKVARSLIYYKKTFQSNLSELWTKYKMKMYYENKHSNHLNPLN